jgi:phosphonate transport system substrate-binding protein
MRKHATLRAAAAFLLVTVMAIGLIGCNSSDSNNNTASNNQSNSSTQSNTQSNAQNGNQASTPTTTPANTGPITVVWYPNESSNDFEPARQEYGRLITEATGREVIHRLTTDYVIAVESIASGAADIGARWGAVGMMEAQQRNPAVMPLIVNSGASGTLDDAVYYGWFAVRKGEEDQYASGNSFSIENIQGKRMSFVSNSSTSGFRVPSANIFRHFGEKAEWSNIDEDDLLGLSRTPFFSEVLFGGSHQGALFNLLDGRADIATVCDTCVDAYIELVSGSHNSVGAIYSIQQGAAAPFDGMGGQEFILIGIAPVLNGPDVYNPQNLSAEEIEAIRAILTSDEAANNPLFFGEAGDFALLPKSGDMRFVVPDNSWYDPLR